MSVCGWPPVKAPTRTDILREVAMQQRQRELLAEFDERGNRIGLPTREDWQRLEEFLKPKE